MELTTEVDWPASDDPIPPSDMAALYEQTWFTHKFAHYIPLYEQLFSRFRSGVQRHPVKMCEIGVARGGSLRLWQRYFPEGSTVVGIDADRRCLIADDPPGVNVRIGDQADAGFLASVVEEFGPFDVILDDGSHQPRPTTTAFEFLFPHGLADGGVYVVEDLFSCYMGNPAHPTFMDAVKGLLDVMHAHYARVVPAMSDAFEVGNPRRAAAVGVPWATTIIGSVQCFDGLVAIHRQPHPLPRILFRTEPW